MHEHFFKEREIYYRTNDFSHDRPTLVLIHGISGSSSAWQKYEERFSGKYNILSFDLRGHGRSGKPKQYASYAMKNFTEDLNELLRYLGIKKCVLVSHSFATLIVFEFLATFPNNVEAVILLSPSYSINKRIAYVPQTRKKLSNKNRSKYDCKYSSWCFKHCRDTLLI